MKRINELPTVVSLSPEVRANADLRPALDPQQLEILKRLQTNPNDAFMKDLAELFLSQTQLHLKKMKQLVVENDYDRICKLAHQLKSSSANLGALRFSELCAVLEIVDENHAPGPMRTLMNDLEIEFERIRVELEDLFRNR